MTITEAPLHKVEDLERELREGRDVLVEMIKKDMSNISVLSSSGVDESPSPVSPKIAVDMDPLNSAEVGSKSNIDLLDETERLLARMSNLSSRGIKSNNGNSSNFNDIRAPLVRNASADRTEDSSELNDMLEKAGQLSSMMQSISENISLNGLGGIPGTAASTSSCGGGRDGGAEIRLTVSTKRDPDGNSIGDLHFNFTSPVAGLTPVSTDDTCTSSIGAKRSVRQDPPGSLVGEEEAVNRKYIPVMNQQLHRPASSVNLNISMMDDDVSSVGSASFRPSGINSGSSHNNSRHSGNYQSKSGQSPSRLCASLTHVEHPDEENMEKMHMSASSRDDLLGIPPKQRIQNEQQNLDNLPYANYEPVGSLPEANAEPPVCHNIPPSDVRANFDVTGSASRRDAFEGAVQWEKVTTARPGEDDYVPIIDYSHERPPSSSSPRHGGGGAGGVISPGLRLEMLRRRNARRKRRQRTVALVVTVCGALAAGAYLQFFRTAQEIPTEVVLEEVPVELFKTFDTTLLQDTAADGYCFEGYADDPSLVVTFPKLVPTTPKVEEKPKRGLFGRRRREN